MLCSIVKVLKNFKLLFNIIFKVSNIFILAYADSFEALAVELLQSRPQKSFELISVSPQDPGIRALVYRRRVSGPNVILMTILLTPRLSGGTR